MTRRGLETLLAVTLIGPAWAFQADGAAQTHWEAYRDWDRTPSEDQRLDDPVLVGAIDLHAHHDPDAYPRQWDAFQVANLAAERGLRAILLKNHWTETAGLSHLVDAYGTDGVEVFGSIALNAPVGGMNAQAVRYMVDVTGDRGRVVWMPTHDSEHEVRFNGDDRPFVAVSRDGVLLPERREVIGLIARHDLTLATGHVTPDEVFMNMEQMRRAADMGAYLEFVSGFTRLPETIEEHVEAIREIGPEHAIISSDRGQGRGPEGDAGPMPTHLDGLTGAAEVLRTNGFSESELDMMFKENPARLLGLPIQ